MFENDTFSGIGLERLEALVEAKLKLVRFIQSHDELLEILKDHERFAMNLSVDQIEKSMVHLRQSLTDDDLVAVGYIAEAFYHIGAIKHAPEMFVAMKGRADGEKGGKKSGKKRAASVPTTWGDEAFQIAQEFVQNNPGPENFNPSRIARHLEEVKAGAKNVRSFETYWKAVDDWIKTGKLKPASEK
jgi:hypothetical protein